MNASMVAKATMQTSDETKAPTEPSFPVGILIVAALMIVFGLAEIVTGFRHEFFGLTTARVAVSTYLGAALGLCYLLGGLLLLTRKRAAAKAAFGLLCADIVGRIAMVVFGLFPVGSFRQTFGIVTGTAIAIGFAVYVGFKSKIFR
jgi:hypothetical protein